MKYLILVIISLFYLPSYSDHKKDPVNEEDKARYEELAKKRGKTEKEWEEFNSLKKTKKEQASRVWAHFNKYMLVEMTLDRMIKVDNPEDFKSMFYWGKYLIGEEADAVKDSKIPDCNKERLEKKECPKAPYQTIYWIKKYFESGYQVGFSAYLMVYFLEYYVIPKTDMEDNEEFFRFWHYIARHFHYEEWKVRVSDYYKKLERRKKENPERFKKIQKACDEDTTCSDPFGIESKKNRIKRLKNKASKSKELLNEKQKEIARKTIDDLMQKWTQKWGKENIYYQKKEAHKVSDHFPYEADETELKRRFLEKNYPHH